MKEDSRAGAEMTRMLGWVCSKWGGGLWGDSRQAIFSWNHFFLLGFSHESSSSWVKKGNGAADTCCLLTDSLCLCLVPLQNRWHARHSAQRPGFVQTRRSGSLWRILLPDTHRSGIRRSYTLQGERQWGACFSFQHSRRPRWEDLKWQPSLGSLTTEPQFGNNKQKARDGAGCGGPGCNPQYHKKEGNHVLKNKSNDETYIQIRWSCEHLSNSKKDLCGYLRVNHP